MGSIGVIMEFADMQGLYEWAKVKPYAITSGKLKNAGAAYKTMDEVERKYFQDLIDETYQQFVTVVKTERKLDDEIVTNYTDGRVFNGRTGVKLGFADSEGTYNDAIELAKELTKVDGKPNLIIPSNRKKRLLEILTESRFISGLIDGRILQNKMQLMGKPLYLMPGAIKF
jgi:protease-4